MVFHATIKWVKEAKSFEKSQNKEIFKMKDLVKKSILNLFAFGGFLVAIPAIAGTVIVPYSGSYDEKISAPSGDYDAIGGLIDVGLFNLVSGTNTFKGSIRTPSDSSDFFAIGIGSNQTLVGASIVFGTNLFITFNPFEYNALFASPGPIWTLEESSPTPTIFLIDNTGGNGIGNNGMTGPKTSNAPSFSRGAGIYGMTIGNGTFATNSSNQALSNGPVDYTMTFNVETRETNPAPEPATMILFGSGIAGVAAAQRRRKVC